MHDLFEGVAIVELKCMLAEFIRVKKFFSLPTLNKRIQNFPFGYTDIRSKPLPLPAHLFSTTSNVALKQSCKTLYFFSIKFHELINMFKMHTSFKNMVPLTPVP